MNVAIYLSSVPNTKNETKLAVLNNFAEGVTLTGDTAIRVNDHRLVNSDISVIQGFVSQDSRPLHLNLRKKVLDSSNTIIIDSNLFQFAKPEFSNYYLRYSLNGVFPNTGFYFDNNIDYSRWEKISSVLGISLKDYRQDGNHILVCLQRNLGWSLRGSNLQNWLDDTVNYIRKVSSRKIIVRKHPGDKTQSMIKLHGNNIEFSTNQYIIDDLKDAWATVTFNSSPGVASLINGVPVFVTDPVPQYSQSYPLCNTNLSEIENPKLEDRTEWLHRISQSHWNADELRSGEAWRFMKERFSSFQLI